MLVFAVLLLEIVLYKDFAKTETIPVDESNLKSVTILCGENCFVPTSNKT